MKIAGVFLLTLLAAATAFANSGVTTDAIRPLAPNHARVTFRVINARGELLPAGKVSRLEWVWSKAAPSDPFESPALRVWLELEIPRGWTVQRITGDAATVAEPFQPRSAEAPPFPPDTLVVDLRARQTSLRLELLDARQRAQELTLSTSIAASRPFVLVQPECRALGVHLLITKVETKNLYVGLSCAKFGEHELDAVFFRSKDSHWEKAAGLIDFDAEGRFTAFKYRFARPARETGEPLTLFRAGTVDERGAAGEFAVYYQTASTRDRYFGRLGLAVTYLKLDESAHGTHLSQYMTNLRLGGGIHLIEDLLDASIDLNGDVVAFTHTPANVPQAHFYGVEPRLSARLPFEVSSTRLWVDGGWMLWGMDVANHVYGIRPLSGLEFLAEIRHEPAGGRAWNVWLKYATIAEPNQVMSTSNIEQALGVTYELGPYEAKPIALTTDFRHDHSVLANQNNGIDGYAFAVGVMKRL